MLHDSAVGGDAALRSKASLQMFRYMRHNACLRPVCPPSPPSPCEALIHGELPTLPENTIDVYKGLIHQSHVKKSDTYNAADDIETIRQRIVRMEPGVNDRFTPRRVKPWGERKIDENGKLLRLQSITLKIPSCSEPSSSV